MGCVGAGLRRCDITPRRGIDMRSLCGLGLSNRPVIMHVPPLTCCYRVERGVAGGVLAGQSAAPGCGEIIRYGWLQSWETFCNKHKCRSEALFGASVTELQTFGPESPIGEVGEARRA